MAHQVEVLILQHPLEVDNAKGTARLLHLCLPRSRLVVGEQWEPQVLQQWLVAPLPGAQPATPLPVHPLLLYPDTAHPAALHLPPPPALALGALPGPVQLRLVVLDGTWRKSRKMLYLNPPLQQLARWPLQGLPASRYRIRKAHAPDQLSTLEATCAALAQLEGDADRFAPVLAAMDGFVSQQLRRWAGRAGGTQLSCSGGE